MIHGRHPGVTISSSCVLGYYESLRVVEDTFVEEQQNSYQQTMLPEKPILLPDFMVDLKKEFLTRLSNPLETSIIEMIRV